MQPPDSEDPLDRHLRAWQAPDPPPDLESRVWRRVGPAAGPAGAPGFDRWFLRSAAAALCVALGALAVGLVGEWRLHQLEQVRASNLAQDYSHLFDPASGGPAGLPEADARLERDLLWLRRELDLSPEQFAQLKSLHQDSAERLQLLAAELTRARLTQAHWEAERHQTGEVDFLSYAFAAKGVDRLQQMSAEVSRSLIDSAAAILTQEQRQRYLRLLGPAGRAPGGTGS